MFREYMRNGIATTVSALMIGCASLPKQQHSYSECPEPKKIESLMPQYNLDNVVAILNATAVHSERIENKLVGGSTRYLVVFYNSKSKANEVIKPKKSKEIIDFVKGNKYDIAQFYEMDNLHQLHNKPSATILISEGKSYVLYDLIGPSNLADGNSDGSDCFEGWQPDFLKTIGIEILKKRMHEKFLDDKERQPPPKKPKGLEI